MALDADTLAQFTDTIRRYVRERLIPMEQEVEEADAIPDEIAQEMRDMGLFGLSIPEEYGGIGVNMSEEVAIAYELGYTSPAFRSVFGTNVGIGSQGILIDGTDAQKQKYLPKMATGEIVGSFALTEPDVGSDAGSVKCKAARDGDHYILNGTKRFITNAPKAHVFTLMARTGSVEDGPRGVTAFLVDADLDGITLGPKDKKMGQRGTSTCDVILNNVRVHKDQIIGGVEGQGFKTAMKVLDRGRLHISAIACGAARRLIDESVKFAIDRKQFGQKIANFQLVQAMLADSEAEWLAAKSMVEAVALAKDTRDISPKEAASCKLFSTEMVGRVADRAVQIHGGAGYMNEYVVEHFYRDVRLFRLYEGTSQIQQIVIARDLIKQAEKGEL